MAEVPIAGADMALPIDAEVPAAGAGIAAPMGADPFCDVVAQAETASNRPAAMARRIDVMALSSSGEEHESVRPEDLIRPSALNVHGDTDTTGMPPASRLVMY
jgi:hypothetical protein